MAKGLAICAYYGKRTRVSGDRSSVVGSTLVKTVHVFASNAITWQ